MQIGFIGLGRMGANMVRRLLDKGGHEVVAYNRSPGPVSEAVSAGATGTASLEDFVATLRAPRAIWLMVPSGDPVDENLAALVRLAEPGDLIIDGGNSRYKETLRRAAEMDAHGLHYMDVGTSGGIWGREIGYCMMAGGLPEDFARIEPVLRTLAPENGYAHVGPVGSGHFSKMIHNGIEYGMMQALAEGFAILDRSPWDYDFRQLADLWQHGSVIRSWLLELATDAFADDPHLEKIAGYVEDTGEGRWTVEAAIDESVAAPVITSALFARFRSREENAFGDRVLAALRKGFGGHAVRPAEADGRS